MLYAVSVETSRTIRHGRMRRRERVYVDARDVDEARSLALQRFRHLRRPLRAGARDLTRIAIAEVRPVDLEKPRLRPQPRPLSAAPQPQPQPKNPRRPKKRRLRKTGATKR